MKLVLLSVLMLLSAKVWAEPTFNYDENKIKNDQEAIAVCAKIALGKQVTVDNQDGFLWKELLCDMIPKEVLIRQIQIEKARSN